MHWLEVTPLWVIGLLVFAGLILAQQLGYNLRRLMMRRGGEDGSSTDSVGYVLSAALALLGLLIAFTFSQAAQRFDARRILVVAEANALGTTYLRIQALDDGPRAALSGLMVKYAHAREGFFSSGTDRALLEQSEARTSDLQKQIWTQVTAAVRASPGATLNPSLLQTTNDLFDLAATRRAALDARLPISIIRALLFYALIAAGIMGYGMAHGRRQSIVSAGLFLVTTVAICLILDLDRPRSGTITVSQAPMSRAIAAIDSAEAAKAVPVPPVAASKP